jgi:hypothetical protein
VTFVAMRRVGVGPEVKTDSQRLGRKSAMLGWYEGCGVGVGIGGVGACLLSFVCEVFVDEILER